MPSDLEERIQQIISKPHVSAFATVTGDGIPWVSYVIAVADEEMIIRFASIVGTRKLAHIKKCPEVHLTCGLTDPADVKPYLQIQGEAFFTTDEEDRHGFWTDMLADTFDDHDDPRYGVTIVEPYRIEYFTPGSYKPEVWSG